MHICGKSKEDTLSICKKRIASLINLNIVEDGRRAFHDELRFRNFKNREIDTGMSSSHADSVLPFD